MRIRTGYSFGAAFGHLEDVLSRLQELKMKVAPITDRNSCFGYAKWTKLAEEAKLRPIYGVEIGVARDELMKRKTLDYWTFWAIKDVSAIHELVRIATVEEGKTPYLTYEQALSAKGVLMMTGGLVDISRLKPRPNLFIPLAPSTPHFLYNAARKRGFAFMATSDNLYPRIEDRDAYRVIAGVAANSQSYPQHICDPKEWEAATWFADPKDRTAALRNADKLAKQCVATLPKAKLLSPKHDLSLREMCEAGAKKLKINLKDKVYRARLDRELGLIAEKKFEDYFFIIADLVQWARQKMIVGPARGSSCGSLVCFLLEITTVDPIPFGLIFERFIDINRADLPDIDLDFSDVRRDMIFEYMERKYGVDRVARLGTVMLYRPRSALREAGGALSIPPWEVSKVLESIIERSGGDSRALQATEDTLKDTPAGRSLLEKYPEIVVASRIEGHPNSSSKHAAGIVITDRPVREHVAMDTASRTTHCDKYDAEVFNFLKIDCLGLTQLSIFEETLRLIGKPDYGNWMDTIPYDDPKAFEVLNKQQWSGIFQFNGMALQSIAKSVTISSLDDIVNITALARPGPLTSGGANNWIMRKNGDEPIDYFHPLFEPYLKDTLGVVAYQEQVMEIARNIGGLSWEDVSALRKSMSKSLGKEHFDKYGDRWKPGAIAKGVPKAMAEKIWDDLCAYGAWAFNKSHSVAYGIISYRCCWLKAHYPVEFAAATMSAETDSMRVINMLRELRSEGVNYVAFDAKQSGASWTPGKDKDGNRVLIGPLTNVKGIGPKTVEEILSSRMKKGPKVSNRTAKLLANARTIIDSLEPIRDAVKRIYPNGLASANIVTEPTPIRDVREGFSGNVLIIGVAERIDPKNGNEPGKVAQRGYAIKGKADALNLYMRDDTDMILTRVGYDDFDEIGKEVIERGRPRRALYAIKGKVPRDFRMIWIDRIKYLGDLDEEFEEAGDDGKEKGIGIAEEDRVARLRDAISDAGEQLDMWRK